jgi:microcystin-dependent protein
MKNWAAGDEVKASDLNGNFLEVLPIGAVLPYAGSSAPSSYLICDGASLLRASYPALFAVIGIIYGEPDGTHFNLPNLKGKIPVGKNAAESEFDALGEIGGEKTHVLTIAELATHHHGGVIVSTGGALGTGGSGQQAGDTADTGSNTAHNNLQPYITLNYIIRAT